MAITSSGTLPEMKSTDQIGQTIVAQLYDLGFKQIPLGPIGKPTGKWSHAYEHSKKLVIDSLPICSRDLVWMHTKMDSIGDK